MKERKTALVTGGSRGIGRAICLRLAREGMNIALTCTRLSAEAEETLRLCRTYGVQAQGYASDVSDEDSCREVVKAVAEQFGTIDILVNNAGITRDGLIMKLTDADFDQVYAVNAKGAFHMMREVSRLMLRARQGRIINISSVVGLMGNAGQVNYAASKAAIIGMTRSLARELASRKITVNAVAPGLIRTDMTEALRDKAKESLLAQIPMGEIGEAEDVAALVSFLAGEDARYITGQVLCVDGGMSI